MEPFERRNSRLSSSSRSSSLYYDLHMEEVLEEFESIENEIFGQSSENSNEHLQVNKDHSISVESHSLLENL